MNQKANQLPIISLDDMARFGEQVARSNMFGSINPDQGAVIVAACYQRGIDLLQFSETYNIVHGRISMRADAMLGRLVELGGSYEIIQRDSERAAIKAEFKSAKGEFSITKDEALSEPFSKDRSGNIKEKYSTPRGLMQMLWARAVSDAVRTVCPIANQGNYTPEEVEDFTESEPVNDGDPVPIVAPPMPVNLPPEAPVADEFSICPVQGECYGIEWVKLPLDVLLVAVQTQHNSITDLHRKAIQQAIDIKQQGGVQQ